MAEIVSYKQQPEPQVPEPLLFYTVNQVGNPDFFTQCTNTAPQLTEDTVILHSELIGEAGFFPQPTNWGPQSLCIELIERCCGAVRAVGLIFARATLLLTLKLWIYAYRLHSAARVWRSNGVCVCVHMFMCLWFTLLIAQPLSLNHVRHKLKIAMPKSNTQALKHNQIMHKLTRPPRFCSVRLMENFSKLRK